MHVILPRHRGKMTSVLGQDDVLIVILPQKLMVVLIVVLITIVGHNHQEN